MSTLLITAQVLSQGPEFKLRTHGAYLKKKNAYRGRGVRVCLCEREREREKTRRRGKRGNGRQGTERGRGEDEGQRTEISK